MNDQVVNVIGAGLAGSEAAFQLARRGVRVRLYEMRPQKMTEAHQTGLFAELVCSNSLRNASLETAVGVLKEEMRRLGSLIMEAALATQVPAGAALAVDRELFAKYVTERLSNHPLIEIVREEVTKLPSGITILASGPLTSASLAAELTRLTGARELYFYDAIAPIVAAESIDTTVAFRASRHGKGGDDYLNCPLTEEQYDAFVEALLSAEKVPFHPFEKPVYFEGCMPIEEMARRGRLTLAFGPMRPVGLIDPRTGRRPFAVVQLRQDDREGRMYNMVGFQTKMTYAAQRRVFRMIPGLEKAEFVRLGSLHRNTFINSPRLLEPSLRLRGHDSLFIAALNAWNLLRGEPLIVPPRQTALGSLIAYITDPSRRDFQPINANYGLMPDLPTKARGRQKKIEMGMRALEAMQTWIEANGLNPSCGGELFI